MKSIVGKKIGMTQVFDENGNVIPVTVIEAGPCYVTQVKTEETDGYKAIQVGFMDQKEVRVKKPQKGHFDKAQVNYKKVLREFRISGDESFELGDEVNLSVFDGVEYVDVTGTSKGKGTQGAIVRHNFSRGPSSHGSKSHRTAGAREAAAYPGRVFPGSKGSGKMGHERVTVQNLQLVQVDTEKNLMLVKGAVPGVKGGIVVIQEAVKLS